MTPQNFKNRLDECAACVNEALDSLLTKHLRAGEIARPDNLVAAMRHGVLNGGKRIRPFLLIECAALFGLHSGQALHAACALECLHSYSLIHDDLPAMDDDDLRRGLPTVHKAFDEATAILAGDALLTIAFDLLSDSECHQDGQTRCTLISLLARAAGVGGMIGGQILDIAAESGSPGEQEIRVLQSMKTGALIRFACEAGAVLGNASTKQRASLVRYGEIVGLAFQLADDLLDITSDAATMGKAVGKDAALGKGTLVGIWGVEKVEETLEDLMMQANDCLIEFGDRGEVLRATAMFVGQRRN